MANRHLSRSIVLQSLFEWDFNGCKEAHIDSILERNIKEFAPGLENAVFAKSLAKGVLEKKGDIDKIIEKAAPEWPIKQIAIVDRNVLRIGLYELLFGSRKEVPPKVAINEAIELAKTFGGDTSSKFVNGVLGTVYREIGEPGKDETGEMIEENLAGGVVYKREKDKIYLGLVHDVFGYWTLSKGHVEEKEDLGDGAVREVKEELGISSVVLERELGNNEYVASDPEKGKIKKKVTYFLMRAEDKDLNFEKKGGLDDARWFGLDELEGLDMYDDIKVILAKAIKVLVKK
jgi:N utilization substance protein B